MAIQQEQVGWTPGKLPLPFGHVSAYKPEPLEVSSGSSIHVLLGSVGMFTICGSGSRFDAALAGLIRHPIPVHAPDVWPVIILSSEIEATGTPPTIAEKLNEVRDAFGLSMAALADILKASRASVYNWFENETPSEGFVRRIETLYRIAQGWETKNPYHYAPGRLMKQKLGDGPSMFERLSGEELNLDEISNGIDGLLVLMNKQREKMDRAKMRSAKAPADDEGNKELLERLTGSVTADK